jgi:hypothetical protein
MNRTPVRIAAFLLGLVAVFAAAAAVGRAVGPVAQPEPATHEGMEADAGMDGETGHGGHDEADEPDDAAPPGGLAVSQDGYTLRLEESAADAGRDVPLAFTIEGPDGAPVTAYDVEHEKVLHLIAVRRDGTGFQHVHPVLDDGGTWRTDLDLTPGDWRVFADFTPSGGPGTTLGADLAVAGDYRPAPPRTETTTAAVDGYTVTLDGHLEPGTSSPVTLTVTHHGRPVTDLQPYLGAYGHLVALREGDLAYLHVHPDGEPGDGTTEPGPEVVFHAEVPSAGRYLLFLDFRHAGEVRTASFVVDAHGDHS